MVGVHLQGSRLRRRSLGTDLSEAEMGRVFTVQINLSPTCSKSSPFSTKIMFTISSRPHYLVNTNAPAYVSVLARVPILQKLVFRKQIICCICIVFFFSVYLYLYLFTCMHLLPLYWSTLVCFRWIERHRTQFPSELKSIFYWQWLCWWWWWWWGQSLTAFF